MATSDDNIHPDRGIDHHRRALLLAAGAGALAAALGGRAEAQIMKTLRWGVVGTGGIANSMAPRILTRSTARRALSPSAVAMKTEPSSPISIFAPVSSWMLRITFPPGPITAPILSTGM